MAGKKESFDLITKKADKFLTNATEREIIKKVKERGDWSRVAQIRVRFPVSISTRREDTYSYDVPVYYASDKIRKGRKILPPAISFTEIIDVHPVNIVLHLFKNDP